MKITNILLSGLLLIFLASCQKEELPKMSASDDYNSQLAGVW